ncbi:MAG: hypothetical protein HRU09_20180 [Oligoflexales bacterium]|nr:hypothetical protein [Oligoflexales bacterium]
MKFEVKNKILSRQLAKACNNEELSVPKLLEMIERTYNDFDKAAKLNFRTSKILEEELQEKETQLLKILNSHR